MINSIENIVAILFVLMIVLAFALVFKVNTSIVTVLNSTYSNITYNGTMKLNNATLVTTALNTNATIVDLFKQALTIFIAITILFGFYSSFIEKLSFQGYIIAFITGIFIGGLVLYITTEVYNLIVTLNAVNGMGLDLTIMPDFFIMNLQNIILANILASSLSFVFSRMPGRRRKA